MESRLLVVCVLYYLIGFINGQQTAIKGRQVVGLQNSEKLTPNYYSPYNASHDAQKLYDAVTGLGTDEDVIINIVANRTHAQRHFIIKTYSDMFGKDLVQDLKSDSSGHFRSVVKALLSEPQVYAAKQLNKALTSFISDDRSIAEILCTKNRDELIPIMSAYQTLFNKSLVSEVDECLEGDQRTFYKTILTEMIREKHGLKSIVASNEQVEIIPNVADYCKVGQNNKLMLLFAKEPFEQIRQVAALHEQIKKKTIEEQLKRWCTDDILLQAYDTVIKFAKDPAAYYASELYDAMIGLGTNDNRLKRIIITRSEIDLDKIKHKYHEMYKTSLASSVEDETSGPYERILLKLISNVN